MCFKTLYNDSQDSIDYAPRLAPPTSRYSPSPEDRVIAQARFELLANYLRRDSRAAREYYAGEGAE